MMFAMRTAAHDIGQAFGHERARPAEAGGDLQISQCLDPVAARSYVATTKRRRDRLGEAPDQDDALQPIERRQSRRGLRLKIREDVIFDNGQAVGRGGR